MSAHPDILQLTRLDQVRAMAHPLRIEILKRLWAAGAPRSVAEVSKDLSEPAPKLHYHFKEMLRLGLLRVARVDQKGNLSERRYEPLARVYRADPRVFDSGRAGRSLQRETVEAVLEATATGLRQLFASGDVDESLFKLVLHLHSGFRLRPADAAELIGRLRALNQEFKQREVEGDEAIELAFTSIAFPRAVSRPAESRRTRAREGQPLRAGVRRQRKQERKND